jgi:hypothetical protein
VHYGSNHILLSDHAWARSSCCLLLCTALTTSSMQKLSLAQQAYQLASLQTTRAMYAARDNIMSSYARYS